MAQLINSRYRVMAHLGSQYGTGETIYAYSIAAAIDRSDCNPGRVLRLLKEWATDGLLNDLGLHPNPNSNMPDVRMFELTEAGAEHFDRIYKAFGDLTK